MMNHILARLACAVLLSVSPFAHAGVVSFDMPGIVDIDNDTNVATYAEGGFAFSGEAATFLPLDGIGTGGTGGLFVLPGSPLQLRAEAGLFSLLAADIGLFDLGEMGVLTITGLLDDNSQLNLMVALSELATIEFDNLIGLRQVSFTADVAFVLDNVIAVPGDGGGTPIPEPASLALMALALAGLVTARSKRG